MASGEGAQAQAVRRLPAVPTSPASPRDVALADLRFTRPLINAYYLAKVFVLSSAGLLKADDSVPSSKCLKKLTQRHKDLEQAVIDLAPSLDAPVTKFLLEPIDHCNTGVGRL